MNPLDNLDVRQRLDPPDAAHIERPSPISIEKPHSYSPPTNLRDQFADESWFALCEQFTDDWDQQAFDPGYDTLPLEHFEPLIRKMTAKAKF